MGEDVFVGEAGASQGAQPRDPRPPAGSYVQGIVRLHYQTDEAVSKDAELQTWCREITQVGLLSAQDRGEISRCLGPPTPERSPCSLSRGLCTWAGTSRSISEPMKTSKGLPRSLI